MFTWRHFVWLAISAIMIIAAVSTFKKKNMSLQSFLSYCVAVCIGSEFIKVFSTVKMVSSLNGTIMHPYIPMNHLPLHLCSLQILLIFYVRFTSNTKMRESVLAFMYPTCICGALAALLMPSIFTTTIPVEKAFVHPQAYQFFVYHSMLVSLGICIPLSNEIKWTKKHLFSTWIIMITLGFVNIYINSMFASPTYVDGVLQHVDFWPNFMFVIDNPLGIPMTEIWHWYIYLVILIGLMFGLSTVFILPMLKKNKKESV